MDDRHDSVGLARKRFSVEVVISIGVKAEITGYVLHRKPPRHSGQSMINLGSYTVTVSLNSEKWESKKHPIYDFYDMTPTSITESLISEFRRQGPTGWGTAKVTLWSHVWRGTGEERVCHDRPIIEMPLTTN